jgi:hypothetical protein
MSLLVLMVGRFALSADFWISAIVYSPEVFGAVASLSHCLLRGFEAGKRGRVAEIWVKCRMNLLCPCNLDGHADFQLQVNWRSSTLFDQPTMMQLKIY